MDLGRADGAGQWERVYLQEGTSIWWSLPTVALAALHAMRLPLLCSGCRAASLHQVEVLHSQGRPLQVWVRIWEVCRISWYQEKPVCV